MSNDSRPWRRVIVVTVIGLVVSFAIGSAFALLLQSTGDWDTGLTWERELLLSMDPSAPPAIDWIMLVLPWSGTNLTLAPVVALSAIWLWRKKGRPDVALELVIAVLGSLLLNALMKDVFDRPRPDLWPRRGQYEWAAYPSGHAIVGIAVFFTITRVVHRELGWKWPFVPAIALLAVNLYSRLYLGVHWPTDVIGGLLIGAAWLVVIQIAFAPFHAGRRARDSAISRNPETLGRVGGGWSVGPGRIREPFLVLAGRSPDAVVIPSGPCHSERRPRSGQSRGIAVIPTERPLYQDDSDSSAPRPDGRSARNDTGSGASRRAARNDNLLPLRRFAGNDEVAQLATTMIIKKPDDIPSSEITPEHLYVNRREFLRAAGVIGVAGAAATTAALVGRSESDEASGGAQPQDALTPFEDVTTYNNFYEFGTDKSDPAENAKNFKTKPWSVRVEGLVSKPATYDLEDFIKPHKLEERVYRMRCVEAWSMVIPWLGFPMADLIKRVEPLASAKYIEFQTLYDPKQMPGQRSRVLPWPYTEGLRLDEAMHPLAIFAVGLYGKMLLPQNGAPLRIVVPWKYGFKGVKSIVRIRFTETQPKTAWNEAAPHEYGFYANVNPEVDHPRWSQARERRIGEFRRRPTLMFNGYADQVAHLYAGMDLRKYY